MPSKLKEILKLLGYLLAFIIGLNVAITRLNGDISFFPLPIAIIFIVAGLVGIISSGWNLLAKKGNSIKIVLTISFPILLLSLWLSSKISLNNQLDIDTALIEAPSNPELSTHSSAIETKTTPNLEIISKPILEDGSITTPPSLGYWESLEAKMDQAIASGQKIEPGDYEEIRAMADKERNKRLSK